MTREEAIVNMLISDGYMEEIIENCTDPSVNHEALGTYIVDIVKTLEATILLEEMAMYYEEHTH